MLLARVASLGGKWFLILRVIPSFRTKVLAPDLRREIHGSPTKKLQNRYNKQTDNRVELDSVILETVAANGARN